MLNLRAIHSGNILIYDTKPGDILVWKFQGQDITDIMRGTGYINSNLGRELFEGDIVTIERTVQFEITYEKDMFMFVAIQIGTSRWCSLKDIIKKIDGIVGTIHDSNITKILNEPNLLSVN